MLPPQCAATHTFGELESAREASGRTDEEPASGGHRHWVRRLQLPAVALSSALFGALVAVIAIYAAGDPGRDKTSELELSAPTRAPRGLGLKFESSRAEEVMGDLSAIETKAVADWFIAKTGASGVRNGSASCVWLAGPSAVELLRPAKAEALAYLEERGSRPLRFARVSATGPRGVLEYQVGPLLNGKVAANATMQLLTKPGQIPFSKRPTEPAADDRVGTALINRTIKEIGSALLVSTFGPIFPQLDGFTGKDGEVFHFLRNDAFSPQGERRDMLKFLWMPPPPTRLESYWLHPVPLAMKVNTTSPDPEAWSLHGIFFCEQGPFRTARELREAFEHGKVHKCPFKRDTGSWNVPTHTSPMSPSGRHPLEKHGGVTWGPWTFTVTQRPSTGLALLDLRFRGERVAYELSLQDAQAAYSGKDSQFFYADAAFSLSQLSASLEPGVDCPEGAHFIPVPRWYKLGTGGGAETDPRWAETFYPICIFEFQEDHTIWRHMQNSVPTDVRGLVRNTVVVRSICTVGNYDYLTDVKFREDGEIEAHTRFAGYIESRYFDKGLNPEEEKFSTIVRPDLAGPVHSHTVAWKVDFDLAGATTNAFRTTRVGTMPVELDGNSQQISKYLDHQYVEKEGVGHSTFVADPRHPGQWSVVDRSAVSAAGNPRGYAVTLSTFATTQVLPDDHPFVRAMPFTKYHVAVTKYHDDEYRVTTPYVQYDGEESTGKAQDLDRFLADGESLLDEDLVVWISVGKEHIVRQEDLPLVSNFGVGFSLQPWNFFEQNMAASPTP